MASGCSVTTVLLQVSHGKRPCLDIIPEVRPQECNQMIRVMEQCWDQDHKKRPPFSGEEKINLSHSHFLCSWKQHYPNKRSILALVTRCIIYQNHLPMFSLIAFSFSISLKATFLCKTVPAYQLFIVPLWAFQLGVHFLIYCVWLTKETDFSQAKSQPVPHRLSGVSHFRVSISYLQAS